MIETRRNVERGGYGLCVVEQRINEARGSLVVEAKFPPLWRSPQSIGWRLRLIARAIFGRSICFGIIEGTYADRKEAGRE